ncbi:hypothetical protein [Streptomyces niveus]|uniref:hypothetical protein n=1 Tax=Streptomyces niveus TaxID=193462 RepID=UPI00386E6169
MSNNDFRETTLRIMGVETVVRTERTGTVKQLEAAHMKAVKAALVELRRPHVPALRARARKVGEGRTGAISTLATMWERGTFPSHGTDGAMRTSFPKVSSKPTAVPAYMIEVAPGEYATPDAARDMGAAEIVDEVLPGLELRRCDDGARWMLRHIPSLKGAEPNKAQVGPVFKTRDRARQVAADELAGFDWTRSADELRADGLTVLTVRVIKLRELIAASKRNAWMEGDLRKAEAELAARTVELAA